MSALRETQRALRVAILDRGSEVPSGLISGLISGIAGDVAERVAIYRNNTLGALTGALRLTYPACHRMVGDDFFDAVAAEFACRRPPRSAWLDDWGEGFAEFLEGVGRARAAVNGPEAVRPAGGLAWLPDLARLEWAAAEAARTELDPVLALSALSGPEAAEPELLRFLPHPSLRLVESPYSIERIWRAALEDDERAIAAIDPEEESSRLLVRRAREGAEVLPLSEDGLLFTQALLAGRALGAALEAVPGEGEGRTLALHLSGASFRGVERSA